MKQPFKLRFFLMMGFIIGIFFITAIIGCAARMPNAAKPGAMLWGENCARCHDIRPPSSLSDEQWDVAVLHMRTRANLTGDEAEKVAAFLKAGN